MFRTLLVSTALLTAPLLGQAQLSGIAMSDVDIKNFLSGNTIGAEDWGSDSLEYHAPDGTAIWDNGTEVQIGEYRIKGGNVCYTYEDSQGSWYCWEFKRDRRTGEVTQWSDTGSSYILFIAGEGDLVTARQNEEAATDAGEDMVEAASEAVEAASDSAGDAVEAAADMAEEVAAEDAPTTDITVEGN